MAAALSTDSPIKAVFDAWMHQRALARTPTSPATVTNYQADLRVWVRHLPGNEGHTIYTVTVSALSTDAIEGAWATMVASTYQDRSLRRRLASLRGLIRFSLEQGILTEDPTGRIRQPGRPQSVPKALEDSGLGRLVAAVANPPASARQAWPARDLAMIATMGGCGTRAAELVGITPASIDRSELWRITVVGKGNKTRTIPAAPEIAATIDHYIGERTALLGAPGRYDPLFVRRDGSALSANAMSQMTRRWETWAGVGHHKGSASHRFRHTYAVGMLLNGVSVPELADLLGHANLETTGIYLKVTGAHLADAAQAAPIRHLLPRP